MTLKGAVQPNHVPLNRYKLTVNEDGGTATPLLVFTVSGIEEELETVDLPDRTKAAGGTSKPVEFTITIPVHHTDAMSFMEQWYEAGKENTADGYKRDCLLDYLNVGGDIVKQYEVLSSFPFKFMLPDMELDNEGEIAMVEWTISADSINNVDAA